MSDPVLDVKKPSAKEGCYLIWVILSQHKVAAVDLINDEISRSANMFTEVMFDYKYRSQFNG